MPMKKDFRLFRVLVIVSCCLFLLTACNDDDDDDDVLRMYGTTLGAEGTSTLVLLSAQEESAGDLIRTIGDVGYRVSGLEYDRVHHKLYALTTEDDPEFPAGLIEINRDTGAGTEIGSPHGIVGHAFYTPTVCSDGELYAAAVEGGEVDYIYLAYLENHATAGIDDLMWFGNGETGYEPEIESYLPFGLSYDPNDNLYLLNGDGDVYAIDPDTGVGTYQFAMERPAGNGDFLPTEEGVYVGIDNVTRDGTYLEVVNFIADDVDPQGIIEEFPVTDVSNLHAITFFYD